MQKYKKLNATSFSSPIFSQPFYLLLHLSPFHSKDIYLIYTSDSVYSQIYDTIYIINQLRIGVHSPSLFKCKRSAAASPELCDVVVMNH